MLKRDQFSCYFAGRESLIDRKWVFVFVKVYTLARLRNRTSLLYRDFAFPTYLFRSLFVIVSRERERAKELECKSCVTCFLSHRLSIARIMA